MLNSQIMVVEDEIVVARNIEMRLKSLGYQDPIVAFSGQEAVQKAGEAAVDLILMDIRLGSGIDGVEAAETIRSRFDLPIIFLTAYTDEVTLQRVKKSEPYGYIRKPFQVIDLQIAIEMALNRRQAEIEQKKLIAKLQEALDTLKTLSGIIPICSSCKKIRDEDGQWWPLEIYIHDHTNADFSHGLCPDCFARLYPGFDYQKP
ncbi:MAG: hypothetical protein Fur0044_04650 [Anaerolineae bacterium]|nr:response regulator [Anaerolineae bacterium]